MTFCILKLNKLVNNFDLNQKQTKYDKSWSELDNNWVEAKIIII